METKEKLWHAIDSRYIVQDVKGAGSHFFDRSSMRFFSSRVAGSGWVIFEENEIDRTYVVVTSERDTYRDTNPREYTVRVFVMSDHCREVSCSSDSAGFGGYSSGRSARVAAAKLVSELAGI
jgi:hypothetical protein